MIHTPPKSKIRDTVPFEIWSGGQTGADRGALEGARGACIPTGGYAPKDYMTEIGPSPDLQTKFGLIDHNSREYSSRTRLNVAETDATVLIAANPFSAGSQLTSNFCAVLRKPIYQITFTGTPAQPFESLDHEAYYLAWWMATYHGHLNRVNFAGNRESVAPGIQTFTRWLVVMMANMYRDRMALYGRTQKPPEPFPGTSSPENESPPPADEAFEAKEMAADFSGEEAPEVLEVLEEEEPVEILEEA